jgi:propane monooxygenase large subunit
MSRQSVAKAHQKIQELSWEPQYHEPVSQYGTDYTFRKAQKKDPLKQVLRSYFPMQEEKDNRVYGAQDGAIRGNMFRQVQERWLEWQKLFLSIIPLPEISAARAMPLLFRTVPNPELHNGQAIQMIDEVRHSTIQQNLKRLYMNNYIDPAGFNNSLRNFQNDYCGTIGRQFAEGFITGDAITAASIYLTIVAETAFTNTLFVAMPAEAAANGDFLLPTVFHSVQSDESRHISNGYATLLMALSDESNHQLLERDLRYAWWNNHRVVDAAIGTFIEYGTKDRRKDRESYAEMWRRWIYDDYYRSYLVPLEKYGLEQGLRARSRAVLRHRLARQLLADRPDDGPGLRVVRVQVPGLVRQVRQVVGELQPPVHAERAPPDRGRERRLRVPAPVLDLHGPVPGPRGHGDGRGRRPVADLLPRGVPVDGRGRVPPDLPGP